MAMAAAMDAKNKSKKKSGRASFVSHTQAIVFLSKEADASEHSLHAHSEPSEKALHALHESAAAAGNSHVSPVMFGAHRHNETEQSSKDLIDHARRTTKKAEWEDVLQDESFDPLTGKNGASPKIPPRKKSIFHIGAKVDPKEEFDFSDKHAQEEDAPSMYCKCLDPLVINPDGSFHVGWTILLIISLIYVAISIPVQLGFQTDPLGGWFYVDFMVDCYFITDFILNFFTGYSNLDKEIVVLSFEKTSMHYLSTGWFYLDLITSIPFGWVEIFSGQSGASELENAQLFKMFRALKAVKILRITRLLSGDAADAIEDLLMTNAGLRFFVKMLKLFLTMSFVLHWMACMWHFIANPTGSSWIRKYFSIYDRWAIGDDDIATMAPEDFSIDMVPFGTRYIAAVYWSTTTMSTVGYGDITPDNNMEIVLASVALVIGGALYGILVGNMVSMVSDVDANTQVYHERMDAILCYMQQRKFPEELQRKIKRYYRRYFNAKSALDEKTVMADLSSKLKDDVAHYMLDELVFDNRLFRGMTPSQLSTLTNVLRPVFFDAEDYIVRYGEETEAMFIIASGHCDIISEDGRVLRSLGWGHSFGEECFLPAEQKKAQDQYFSYSVMTHEVCEVMVVPAMETRIAFSDRVGCNAMDRIEAKMERLPTIGKHIQQMNIPRRSMTAKKKFKGAIKATAFGVKLQSRLTIDAAASAQSAAQSAAGPAAGESDEAKAAEGLKHAIRQNRMRFLGANSGDDLKSKLNILKAPTPDAKAESNADMEALKTHVNLMKEQLAENNALLAKVLSALENGGGSQIGGSRPSSPTKLVPLPRNGSGVSDGGGGVGSDCGGGDGGDHGDGDGGGGGGGGGGDTAKS